MPFLNGNTKWRNRDIQGARRLEGRGNGCLPEKMASKLKFKWESPIRREAGEMESFLEETMCVNAQTGKRTC